MEAATTTEHSQPLDLSRRFDWGAVPIWLLGFGLIAYLGMEGGGYDPLIHDPVAIGVWWVVLVAVLIGAIPRRPPGLLGWAALALLAVFVVWTGLSLGWTESPDKTSADLARVAGYLGVFLLALLLRKPRSSEQLLAAVGSGIAFIALVALLSRLHPSWFPEAEKAAKVLNVKDRLSYPLNYWNGLAALVAIGMPLMLLFANQAKSVLMRALAAAVIPAMWLTVYFAISRAGVAASVIALAVFVAFTADRLPSLLTLLVAGAGSGILILAASRHDALQEGLFTSTAHSQGNQVLLLTIVVCVAVGLIQAGIAYALDREMRPEWTHVSRETTIYAVVAGVVIVLIAAVAFNGPSHASHAWSDFKKSEGPGQGAGRLTNLGGESRYQFWSAAVKEEQTKPLTGTGSGTFEFWWLRNGTTGSRVRDTHSLYFQTLGELGIVGFALIVSFLLVLLIGGGRNILRASQRRRAPLAAALAGAVAFCLTAGFDWMWQIPVVAIAMLLLGSVLVDSESEDENEQPSAHHGFPLPVRAGVVVASIAAIVAIAIPLATASLLQESQDDAQKGDVSAALSDARSAQNVQPGNAGPRLQEALLLESSGNLAAAAAAAEAATERESTNWQNWLVLSRIEAKLGNADASVSAYETAKSLNPRSSLFSSQ